MGPRVIAVSRSRGHTFSKQNVLTVRLVAGLGVEGDVHCGVKVQHVVHANKNPDAPNRRQVHLIQEELFDELRVCGFQVRSGDMGENVTTREIDLLSLPTGTRLQLGNEALIELTGLRHPCRQVDKFAKGLDSAMLSYDARGELIRRVGVMAIVLRGGNVMAGDAIGVELPDVHWPLGLV